jgi:hypothetical protein
MCFYYFVEFQVSKFLKLIYKQEITEFHYMYALSALHATITLSLQVLAQVVTILLTDRNLGAWVLDPVRLYRGAGNSSGRRVLIFNISWNLDKFCL